MSLASSSYTEFVLRRGSVYLAFALFEAFLLLWSWQKWSDLIVDAGFNFYTFWRLSLGELLYRDVAYYHGPLAPYLSASFFRFFGQSILSVALPQAFLVLCLACLLYEILAALFSGRSAFCAVLFFLVVFAFSQYTLASNYNYVLPFKPEALYAPIACLSGFYCYLRFLGGQHPLGYLFGFGAAWGAVLLTSIEFAFAFSGAFLFLCATQLRRIASKKDWLMLLLGAVFLPLCFFLFFSIHVPLREAFLHTFTAERYAWLSPKVSDSLFYATVSGFDQPLHNLMNGLFSTGAVVAFFALLAALDFASRQSSAFLRRSLAFLLPLALFLIFQLEWAPKVPRSFSFLIAALLVGILIRERKELGSLRSAFALFSFLLIWKVFLHVYLGHYSIFLAMPAVLFLVSWLLHSAPAYLARRHGGGELFLGASVLMLSMFALFYFLQSNRFYSHKIAPIGYGADTIMSMDPRMVAETAVVHEAISWIEGNVPPYSTLLALPEGSLLNYLTRRARASHDTMNVMELYIHGEQKLLSSWKQTPPDFVALIPGSAPEFGFEPFGRREDYGKATMEWIRSDFEEVKVIGARPFESGLMGAQFFKRRAPKE